MFVLRFLQAELKAEAAGRDALAKQYRDTKLGDDEPHIEYAPVGRTGPEPYMADSKFPPTPRQLRPFLREEGCDKAIAAFSRFRKEAPAAPIYHEQFELFLVSDLLDQGKTRDATAFSDEFRQSGLNCVKVFLSFGKSYQGLGRSDRATDFYKRVLLLDPSNTEASAKLKELVEADKKGKGD